MIGCRGGSRGSERVWRVSASHRQRQSCSSGRSRDNLTISGLRSEYMIDTSEIQRRYKQMGPCEVHRCSYGTRNFGKIVNLEFRLLATAVLTS